ncbi:DNA-processing protein DprA [Phaeobacter sp. CAU 1743]|uniref:DNA-processing protein DprA n=1 Tax=Phaeobacter sp. CAU 1743 TaxID=3140367 RepID=UPI00325C14CF
MGFETLKSVSRQNVGFSSFFKDLRNNRPEQKLEAGDRFPRINEALETLGSQQGLLDTARRNLDFLFSKNISVLFPFQDEFPMGFHDLQDFPEWLFVEGDVSVLSKPSITAVGSRKTSSDGLWLADYLGYCLPKLQAVTVSGLADGIDQMVHQSSIRAGMPTVAVLGSGILADYPRGSQKLRSELVEAGGAVVTEYLPSDGVSAKNFVRRNRIQAALGKTVFPVEWAAKSGTAHTVKFAYNMGRPIVLARTTLQQRFDWVPVEYRQVGAFFTLPTDHDAFIRTLVSHLHEEAVQLSLI